VKRRPKRSFAVTDRLERGYGRPSEADLPTRLIFVVPGVVPREQKTRKGYSILSCLEWRCRSWGFRRPGSMVPRACPLNQRFGQRTLIRIGVPDRRRLQSAGTGSFIIEVGDPHVRILTKKESSPASVTDNRNTNGPPSPKLSLTKRVKRVISRVN